MLSGDNGILQKATLSKEKTERAEIIETAQMDILGKIFENHGSLSEEELEEILISPDYNTKGTLSDNNEESILQKTLISSDGKYQIPVSEIYNGNFVKQANITLAKDVLVVNTSASTDIEKSPFVNYPSSKGTILCRTLYNDSTNGLQIFSINPVVKVGLGINDENSNVTGTSDIKKAQNSYNRAITSLNEKAIEYKDIQGIASDARCIGSNPTNKNYPENLTGDSKTQLMTWENTGNNYFDSYSGSFWISDDNYTSDKNRLNEIGEFGIKRSNAVDNYYWLASRSIKEVGNEYLFCVNTVPDYAKYTGNFEANYGSLFRVNKNDGSTPVDSTGIRGFRPVFILNSNVKIIGGQGTEDDPFEIDI